MSDTEPTPTDAPRQTPRAFVRELIERAVKSAAQAAILVLGADQLDVFAVDWQDVAGLSLGAALLSALTSLASRPIGPDHESPSLV